MTEALAGLSLAFITGVVWLVRLEGRINAVEKSNERTQTDVDVLRIKHESLDSELVKELTQIKVTLAKIEGFLAQHKEND